jgi:dihydroorotase
VSAPLLIRGGTVVDPRNGLHAARDLLLREGKVAEVGERLTAPQGAQVIDAAGKWVFPGLVDLHVHLREPGGEGKETILTGSQAAAAGGYTSVVAMPNTSPVIDSGLLARFVADRGRAAGLCRVYPSGAITKGQQGRELADMGELVEAGCVCLTDDGRPVMDAGLMRRALQWARPLGVPLMLHEEDLNLSARGVMNEGEVATRMGLAPIPASAEVAMIARDLVLAEETGGWIHLAHVSCEASVRLLREARRRGVRVTAEATPHHFTLTDEALEGYDTHAKMNPPLRHRRDVEALQEALADGTLDAIATDHAPHGASDKEVELDRAANGVVGLETALPLTLALVHQGQLSLERAVELLSASPARLFGLPGGHLGVGAPADVVVVEPQAEWVVDRARFFSRSRNTPFHGRRVKGQVACTVLGGKVVFASGAIQEAHG